mgnify:FL=1
MAIGLSALRVELLTDPASLGYTSYVSNGTFSILTGMVNSVSANAHTVTSAVTVGIVQAQALQIAVVAAEYLALSAGHQALWNSILTAGTIGISISNTVLRQQVTTVWSAGTTTRGNLAALQTRPCSRGEALFGEGATVDVNEVAKAVQGDF